MSLDLCYYFVLELYKLSATWYLANNITHIALHAFYEEGVNNSVGQDEAYCQLQEWFVHIQLRGTVTNQPPLKILVILDTDNNKALDCGLQLFFYSTVF